MSRAPRNRRTPRRINFGTDVTWSAVSTVFDEATIDNPHVVLDVRIMAAARARIDPSSHSHWRPGELRNRLVVIGSTGELTPVTRENLNAAIRRLTSAKILQAGSSGQCLAYSVWDVQTGMRNGAWPPCPRKREDR
jgi:hypothetical protein